MLKVNKAEIELDREFIFFGSKIVHDGSSTLEIKRRINVSHPAMVNMNKTWRSKDTDINTKNRLVRAIVFPVMMYRCESWTLKKS